MSYKKQLDEMVWSFSRIHSWETCPYFFYRHYLCGDLGEDNWYAENGSVAHSLFEKILRGEMTLEEAPEFYIKQAELIASTVRQNTMDSTIEQIADYLCTVDPLPEKYSIIGVEDKFNFKIDKYNMIGFADFILKDNETGTVILGDHKSSAKLLKKNGEPYANQKANFESYKTQMYLYCIGMKEKYGYYPDKLIWHHFKNGDLDVIDFDENEVNIAREWVINTIKKIYKDRAFKEKIEFMQCKVLCDYRHDCEYLEAQE